MPRPKSTIPTDREVIELDKMMVIRYHLKEILDEKNVSQRRAAEMSGLRYGFIGELCTNKTKYVAPDALATICQVFDVPLERLMTLELVPGEKRKIDVYTLPKYDNTGRNRIYD